jgi:virginiamycin B lyase
VFFLLGCCAGPLRAAPPSPAVLSGQVTSGREGPMEGVLVSAASLDRPVTVTVVTDAHGDYSFPAAVLPPGRYALSLRAEGYELAGTPAVTVAAGGAATASLNLLPTKDLAAQLTNTEWLESFPGPDAQKRVLLECMSCHTLERIARSHFDATAFVPMLQRMQGYANNSTPLHQQLRVVPQRSDPTLLARAAAYLATVNLSAAPKWSYALQTLPRPKGDATRVVIIEYRMPRPDIAPHDVYRDAAGRVWFSEFSEQKLGMLDPATGEVTEYPIPLLKPGSPVGTLDLEPGPDGTLWLALMFQDGVAEFDTERKTFKVWRLPPTLDGAAAQQSMVGPPRGRRDGPVWTNAVDRHGILRLDPRTGAYKLIEPFAGILPGHSHSPYGMAVDAADDLYFMDFDDENIVRIDGTTEAVTIYPTPTPGSRPRRGMLDAHNRLWFAEYGADRIGMFDTVTEDFREWPTPERWAAPYDAAVDREGTVWSVSMANDRVTRLDSETGRITEYLLPHQTNARKLFVDDRGSHPKIWLGNNHHATIIEVEPEK